MTPLPRASRNISSSGLIGAITALPVSDWFPAADNDVFCWQFRGNAIRIKFTHNQLTQAQIDAYNATNVSKRVGATNFQKLANRQVWARESAEGIQLWFTKVSPLKLIDLLAGTTVNYPTTPATGDSTRDAQIQLYARKNSASARLQALTKTPMVNTLLTGRTFKVGDISILANERYTLDPNACYGLPTHIFRIGGGNNYWLDGAGWQTATNSNGTTSLAFNVSAAQVGGPSQPFSQMALDLKTLFLAARLPVDNSGLNYDYHVYHPGVDAECLSGVFAHGIPDYVGMIQFNSDLTQVLGLGIQCDGNRIKDALLSQRNFVADESKAAIDSFLPTLDPLLNTPFKGIAFSADRGPYDIYNSKAISQALAQGADQGDIDEHVVSGKRCDAWRTQMNAAPACAMLMYADASPDPVRSLTGSWSGSGGGLTLTIDQTDVPNGTKVAMSQYSWNFKFATEDLFLAWAQGKYPQWNWVGYDDIQDAYQRADRSHVDPFDDLAGAWWKGNASSGFKGVANTMLMGVTVPKPGF